jgi:Uma2 family endonuclease
MDLVTTAAVIPPGEPPFEGGERRFVINGVSWEQYEKLRELLDSPGIRMTYLEGALELTSPSRLHEQHKKLIARLVEAYALERGIDLNGYGSTTFRRMAKERGAEPDECYMVGVAAAAEDNVTPPHIALEVVITHSDINKLSVYAGLEVRELWFWDGRQFSLHELEGDHYVTIERSRFLPELDFELVRSFIDAENQTAAVRAYLERLRAQ